MHDCPDPACHAAAYAPLPFAVAHLGWVAGVFFLALAGLVTWYTSLLLASLDRHDGHRHVRYCDLARSICGGGAVHGLLRRHPVNLVNRRSRLMVLVLWQAGVAIGPLYSFRCYPCNSTVEPPRNP